MKKIDILAVLLVAALSIAPVFSSYADIQGIFELNLETYPTVPTANDILQKAFSDNSDSASETTGVLAETAVYFAETTETVEENAGTGAETTESDEGITESVEETDPHAMDSTDMTQKTIGPTVPSDYAKTEEELLWELENKAWLEEQLRLQNETLHALQIGEFSG